MKAFVSRGLLPTVAALAGVSLALVASGCDASVRTSSNRGRTIHVSTTGSDHSSGTKRHPLRSIEAALRKAQPGDTVAVASGVYREQVHTVRSGAPGAPITLSGQRGAVIRGDGSGHLVQIGNDYITLRGFTIADANKLVWIEGAHHVRIEHNRLENAGGECVRIKYLSTDILVAHNEIGPCGLTGFDLARNEHNGEGVYIGTDPGQLGRNPTRVPDASDDNRVVDNKIATYAAECVDIKEAADHNAVIGNDCSHSHDPKGSGFDSRGNDNLFRANISRDNVGAGIRFGGYGENGIGNSAVDNVLVGNRGWAFLVLKRPQGRVCGNVVRRDRLGVASVPGLHPLAPC